MTADPRRSVLQSFEPRPAARLRLLCLPFAGGGASNYRSWSAEMPPDVEVVAVQPPGRETRIAEAAHTDMASLIDEILGALEPPDPRPLALFGHSMGAFIALELAYALIARGRPPVLLAVSAQRSLRNAKRRTVAELDDDAFLALLRRLGGTPEGVLDHPELMQLLMPTLRADLTLLERYRPPERPPLALPLVVYGGESDQEVPPESLTSWRELAGADFHLEVFPGDHFYLKAEAEPDLRSSLLRRLLSTLEDA